MEATNYIRNASDKAGADAWILPGESIVVVATSGSLVTVRTTDGRTAQTHRANIGTKA